MRAARRLSALLALCCSGGCSSETVVGVVHGEPPEGECLAAPQPVDRVEAETCVETEAAPCAWECLDSGLHAFGVECDDHTCRCTYDGATICVCVVEGTGSICFGQLEPCCPEPWVVP